MRSPSTFFDSSFNPSLLRTTPARKPRTECCCQPVAAMMAATVAPARSRSIVMTCAFLVPVRILSSADDAIRAETDGFDDLDFDRLHLDGAGSGLVLGFCIGHGVLRGFVRRPPSHHLGPTQGK